jgi:hypothetical protein
MDPTISRFLKRLVLLSICSTGVIFALALASRHGLLSPRAMGIALLILCVAIGAAAVRIAKKTSREFKVPAEPPGAATDVATRNRLLWRIRMAKMMIVLMGGGLAVGIIEIKDGPILPWLVGLALNLLTTGRSIQVIVQSKKLLNGTTRSPIL